MKTSKLMAVAMLLAIAGTSFIETKSPVSKKTQKRHKAAKAAASKRTEIEAELLKLESDALLAIDAYNWSISSATALAAKASINSFILYINQRNAALKSDNDGRKRNNKTMRTGGSSAGVVTADERKKINNNNEIMKKNNAMIKANKNIKAAYTKYLEDIKNNVAIEVKTSEEIQAGPTAKLLKNAMQKTKNAIQGIPASENGDEETQAGPTAKLEKSTTQSAEKTGIPASEDGDIVDDFDSSDEA